MYTYAILILIITISIVQMIFNHLIYYIFLFYKDKISIVTYIKLICNLYCNFIIIFICRDSIVVSTSRCGRENPGSNPGHGKVSLCKSNFVMAYFLIKYTYIINIILLIFN